MICIENYVFFAVAPHAVDDFWPRYERFIAASVTSGTVLVKAEHLRELAAVGAYQLWGVECDGAPVGAFMTTTCAMPEGRQMDVEFLGGADFFAWGPRLWPAFEENAKQQGITTIRMCGRPGWSRAFRSFGYSPDIVIAAKRL